jgi:hypothetical protein
VITKLNLKSTPKGVLFGGFGSICKMTFYKINMHDNRGGSSENKAIILFLLTFLGESAIIVNILGGSTLRGKESK